MSGQTGGGRKRRHRFPWGWIWLVLVAGGAGGFFYWQRVEAAAALKKLPPGVQTARVERGAIEQKITATGVVAAQIGAKVNIGSQISGRIATLNAELAGKVTAGQIVAVIEAPDLEAQVEQQRQSVAVAESAVRQAESRLRQAELGEQLSVDQTIVQVQEAEFAVKAANERVNVASASARLQPAETAAQIARSEAALSTAHSQEKQVRESVNFQLAQAQTSIDEAQSAVNNGRRIRQRAEALLRRGFAARQEFDDARTALEQAEARLQSAKATRDVLKVKLEADLQAARDQVAQAEASLRAARAGRLMDEVRSAEESAARETLRQAEASLRLRKTSRTQDIIRQQAVQEARSALNQASATLKQSRAVLRYQEALLDKAIIRAPITGTVLAILTQQGETVAAGFQTPTLITVADLNRLEVRAYVDEVDVGQTRIGMPAEIRVETFRNRRFRGKVAKIASASTVKDNIVTYETTIALENPEGLLRPDMTADVTLLLNRLENVLVTPSEAIHREVNRSVVYVLHRAKQGKERVETRTVTTGRQSNTHTEITTGLKAGEEVILAGLQRLGVKALDSQQDRGRETR